MIDPASEWSDLAGEISEHGRESTAILRRRLAQTLFHFRARGQLAEGLLGKRFVMAEQPIEDFDTGGAQGIAIGVRQRVGTSATEIVQRGLHA